MADNTTPRLFLQDIHVINIGLDLFSDTLQAQQVAVTQLQWEPPAQGDPELMDMLNDLL
ncbi:MULTISPECIES: hypothetical protein [Spongiibacter]|jgi:hypothetical protein|uniref:hypothetical protein n=1 Tax=Spongiibacter TaxID=630749 RepID=UPI0004B15943|nr:MULTISPECIES: hypothetical protein [Spongiibacter]MBO6753858.1 hypothetical protein [Spongiibacter sp.]|tara:strand:+ start:572 stop:748 length:177 start_codon:yes stop_codon:yes gene_type:complete